MSASVTTNFLVCAGGGGAQGPGGGGGGGGVLGGGSGDTLTLSSAQTITVGAGGAGGASFSSGSNSSIAALEVAVGGGKGGQTNTADAASGGCGGGGGPSSGAPLSGGAGTAGQGYAGGASSYGAPDYPGGGGGGAGAVGGNATSGSVAGNGGAGKGSNISGGFTGALSYYGGGGGGGMYTAGGTGGTGGTGGGGNGNGNGDGAAGTANTGGGGGGGLTDGGGAGGEGVVILAYISANYSADGSGGAITYANGYTIHTFTSSGTFAPPSSYAGPTGVAVVQSSGTSGTVTWTDSPAGVTFQVFRGTDSTFADAGQVSGNINPGTESYLDTGLSQGVTYYYWVQATFADSSTAHTGPVTLYLTPPVAPRRAFLAGVEITNFVTDWGELDEIKSVLLGQDQLFTSQLKLKVANDTGIFSPGNPSSFLYGQQEYNQPVEVYFYNTQIFGGVLKASEVAYLEKTADLMIENQFSNLAVEICTASGSAWAGVNPALAILSLLQNAGLSAQVNSASFAAAAGPALSAGAVVTLSYTASDQVYLLAAINDIANLASLTVYVQNSTIFCSVYQAYQGNGSNLRQTITAAYVRDWGTRVTAYNSFYNEVVVPYGASSQVQLDNVASQTATGTISTQSFSTNSGGTGSTGAIVVADSVSATFFAQQYLSRASVIRDTFSVKLGPEFADAVIGYRYPVTAALWGWQGKPFECIETKKTLLDKGIELTLASV